MFGIPRRRSKIFRIVIALCFLTALLMYFENRKFLNEEKAKSILPLSLGYEKFKKFMDVHMSQWKQTGNLEGIGQDIAEQSITVTAKLAEEQMTCKIPVLDPLDPEMMKIINSSWPSEPRCMNESGMMFKTDLESHLIRTPNNDGFFNIVNCSYSTYKRGSDDSKVENSSIELSYPITEDITLIPPEHEFIRVRCHRTDNGEFAYEDFFGFVNLKPEVEARAELNAGKVSNPEPDQLSVVILGLDSVSHMNFQRFMVETRKFLLQNMSAIEFYGRNKVHESTFANVLPTLTGWQTDELMKTVKCWTMEEQYFDTCPFIWKEFARKGYRTVYGEDQIDFSIFMDSTLNGFEYPVADYDFRTMLRGMEKFDGGNGCFSHKSTTQVLLHSLALAANTLKDKPYFHFTWITSFTHNVAGYAKHVDPHVFNLLKTLTEKRLLDRTVLILMSDHGMTFGQYVQTEQGMLESRMPMLNIVFPDWFSKKYSRAIENLKANTHRLSTPYDLHEALKDLLSPTESISNFALTERENEAYYKNRGISLFLPIPLNRTCSMAGIEDHYCICWSKTPVENPAQDKDVKLAVEFSVQLLNEKLRNFPNCAILVLQSIILARKLNPDSTQFVSKAQAMRKYEVVFVVSPSSGVFEATVVLEDSKLPKIGGPISRINAYKQQGDCIDTTPNGTLEVKSMCYCTSS